MAKKDAEAPAEYTAEDITMILQDLEGKNEALAVISKKLDSLVPVVERLQLEVQLGEPKSDIPAEIYKGVQSEAIYGSILQGCIIGLVQVYGPSLTSAQWDAISKKIATMSDTLFKHVMATYVK
jgi:hypothetical protein